MKMTDVLIVHGTKGSPDGNWFPWLKSELQKRGCRVIVPNFPTPENQSLSSWLKTLDSEKISIGKNTILVGHSLGPAFLLSVIQNLKEPAKAAFFVSGFINLLWIPEYDKLNKSFLSAKFDWDRIRHNCKKYYSLNSDNDPYVPLEKGLEISRKLGVKPIIIKGAGHMNSESGHTKFEFLLELIEKEL